MKYKRFDNKIVVRLERKEEILTSFMELVKKENIRLGSLSAIGATDDFTVGALDLTTKEYKKNHFKGTYEITSLVGNISEMNGEPYLHLHMTCADEKGSVVGGHLNEAYISATLEACIDVIDGSVDRFKDKETGINLLDL